MPHNYQNAVRDFPVFTSDVKNIDFLRHFNLSLSPVFIERCSYVFQYSVCLNTYFVYLIHYFVCLLEYFVYLFQY